MGRCCSVELFGPARLLAGVKQVDVEMEAAVSLGALIPALAARCPVLIGPVLDLERGALVDGYILNRNGRDFLADTNAIVRPGDRLLLLANLGGG